MDKLTFRGNASFGKRQEYSAIAELLKRGFDVYLTLVDDQGIDCIIRKDDGKKQQYLDIQIKARSKDCEKYDAARFAAMTIPDPRENYWFIFYSEQLNTYWVINSLELTQTGIANKNKQGKNAGKWHINLAKYSKKRDAVSINSRFDKYRGDAGFSQLN